MTTRPVDLEAGKPETLPDYRAPGEGEGCCFTVCTGRTPWYLSCFLFPFVLIWNAITVYLWPCLYVVFGRCFATIYCCLCRKFCRGCYMYEDDDFPAITRSLATVEEPNAYKSSEFDGLTDAQVGAKVDWIRASELCDSGQMNLFADGIEPSDVVQGALGDCWLLAAFAALAEFPGAIENCFKTYEQSDRGKYAIRLFDARKGMRKRVSLNIDDMIPCDSESKQPIFSKPKGNEMWVLLLEKAFAKFCGGYSALKGGHAMWAMQAITGDNVFRLEYEEEKECWARWDIEYDMATSANRKKDWNLKDSGERFNHERIWELLKEYDKNDALITASVRGTANKVNEELGIIEGHTYTVRQVNTVKDFRLLQLRNPWGTFEWNGDWGDESPLWKEHSSVATKVKFEAGEDGIFFMEYKDFFKIFNVVQICDRSSIRNLHLNVNEDKGGCGVVSGCCSGCFRFWCCCQGCTEIYCGRKTSYQTIDTGNPCLKACCSCCYKEEGKAWRADA